MKPRTKLLGILAACTIAASGVSASAVSGSRGFSTDEKIQKTVIVSAQTADVRSTPRYARNVTGTLHKGNRVQVVACNGFWYRIEFDSDYGYVPMNCTREETEEDIVSDADETAMSKLVTTTASLKVRKGPGKSYDSIGTLDEGTKASVVAKSGDWNKIKYENTYGYISSSYTKEASSSEKIESDQKESTQEETAVSKTVTTTADLSVRKGAGKEYDRIGLLDEGTKVSVVAKSGGWYKIKYEDGYGYISSEYTKEQSTAKKKKETKEVTDSETALKKTVKATENLNIRAEADKSSKSLGTLPKGTKVKVIAQTGEWYKIKYDDGAYGYINSEYTK